MSARPDLPRLLSVARGDAPADLLLANCKLINVFSAEIETSADIAICGDTIAGVGRGYQARETADLNGSYVAPGLIDAHVHIESSLCVPANFATAVVPRGVTTVVTDPHEIANVAGLDGVRFMADSSRGIPLNVIIMAPSCVPATHMGTSGATLEAVDLVKLRDEGIVHGLAEVMNFPGVILGSEPMLAKLRAFEGRPLDGHCPAVMGKALNAYVAAGIGSDHEGVAVAEAAEKLARGMYILIREATNARNLHALLPLITPANSRRICFCTDDRQPADLLRVGSIDHMIREAIAFGIDPITAIRMATLNPAEWFGLRNVGAIAPGRRADLFVFDQLHSPEARLVLQSGRLVAEGGQMLPSIAVKPVAAPETLTSSCHIAWDRVSFKVESANSVRRIRVIGSVEDQLVTDELALDAHASNGQLFADMSSDILKMAVIERHRGSGNVGLGFIHGIGLKRGAIAGTVAHDHHNLVTIGCDDASMMTAAKAVAAMGGGLVAAEGDRALASLALPVAGLMSDRPIDEVRAAYEQLLAACRDLGSPLHDPFMAMSFMALEVIPKLKLTDQGLVDVTRFAFTDLFV